MSSKTTLILGLTALTLLLALAPRGMAAGDRERVTREGRQIVRENRITAHQIQVESKRAPRQAAAQNASPPPAPTQTTPPQTPRR